MNRRKFLMGSTAVVAAVAMPTVAPVVYSHTTVGLNSRWDLVGYKFTAAEFDTNLAMVSNLMLRLEEFDIDHVRMAFTGEQHAEV